MRVWHIASILAPFALAMPSAAWASPEAPSTPEELARDREIIRNLNLRELAYVRRRDAAQAQQQEAGRDAQEDYKDAYDDWVRERSDFLRRRNTYQSSMDNYAQQRLSYDNAMAEWRRKVAACRAGDSSACDR